MKQRNEQSSESIMLILALFAVAILLAFLLTSCASLRPNHDLLNGH